MPGRLSTLTAIYRTLKPHALQITYCTTGDTCSRLAYFSPFIAAVDLGPRLRQALSLLGIQITAGDGHPVKIGSTGQVHLWCLIRCFSVLLCLPPAVVAGTLHATDPAVVPGPIEFLHGAKTPAHITEALSYATLHSAARLPASLTLHDPRTKCQSMRNNIRLRQDPQASGLCHMHPQGLTVF
jgi:hypothetical protein